MRSALLALLLGGCLIVRTTEEPVEEPCPSISPVLLADTSGPFVLGADAIYFEAANGTLSRVSYAGGSASELTTSSIRALRVAADASYIYWIAADGVARIPVTGGSPTTIVTGFTGLTALAIDETSVAFASDTGLHRWLKANQNIETLDIGPPIYDVSSYEGVYYYTVTRGDVVRRTPPTQDLASPHLPGPLFVDDRGVYYSDVVEPLGEYGIALRLVPREGGTPVTTARDLALVIDLTADDTDLYFVTAYASTYRIEQVSRFGGAVRTLACGRYEQQPVDIAVDDTGIFFSDGRGLYRIDKPMSAF